MSAVADPQTRLDELEIDDAKLLAALDDRQAVKEQLKQQRKAFKEVDDRAKALVRLHDLQDDQAVRIGRYRITRKPVASRAVQFETDPTSRLTISLLPE